MSLRGCSQIFVASLIVALLSQSAHAEWPSYQHDSSRSGSTTETAPRSPSIRWAYQSPSPPVSAWDEPAMWDGWSKVHDLKNRQVFDKVFHVAVAKNHVYFGSSVDDQVYCLDAQTGEVAWTFYTEGPVRLAPTFANGRLYFGSDDGFVYCLEHDTGKLIWKKSPGPNTRRVAGNGRVVSPWAIRTSVVVEGDTAYCGAGVMPSEGVFVVALNATTGDELWKTEMNDLPAQGYMLASKTRLYVVTSRDTPLVLDAKTGKRLHKVQGGAGGTYALLTGDTLLYGPSKTGDVNMIGEQQDVLASFQGNHMIVAQPLSYLQSRDELSSLDRGEYVKLYGQRNAVARQMSEAEKRLKKARGDQPEGGAAGNAEVAEDSAEITELKSKVAELTEQHRQLGEHLKACLRWRTKCNCPYSLVLADDTLVAGGDGELIAVDANSGKQLWHREIDGKAYGLAISDGQLLVSTDTGFIYCFADGDAIAVEARDIPQVTKTAVRHPVRFQPYAGPRVSSDNVSAEIHGPFAEFVGPHQVRVEWDTTEPTTSTLTFGVDIANAQVIRSEELTQTHELFVDNVQRDVVHRFQVGGKCEDGREIMTEAFSFDAYLYYLPANGQEQVGTKSRSPYDSKRPLQAIAKQIVADSGANRGYALVVGATDGQLAYELALASELQIVVVEPDAEKVKQIRENLSIAGLYGTRVTVHHQQLDEMQYGPFLANIITSESMLETGKLAASFENLYQSLRPAGGLMFLGVNAKQRDNEDVSTKFATWREQSGLKWTPHEISDSGADFWSHRRGKLPNTGEWTHQYASADNSACSRDEQIRGAMMVQWWGRPGSRPMPDRGNRNPPPVSANGRLYVQGNRTLFGLDAYNGTILWAKQIPTMRRANMPRDGSNMVAADDHVCVAIAGRCVAFDGQSGNRLKNFEVPEGAINPGHAANWGYVSRIGSSLFGTAVRRGAQYMGDQGEWYESFGEKDVAKVTSDSIFSVNAYSGETEWLYQKGVLINSTITIADGLVYFVESRSDAARDAQSGRMFKEVLVDQVLVALDAATGSIVWEKPYDFSSCKYVTYMTTGSGTLLVTGTNEKSVFHTYAFDAKTGQELWHHEAPEKKGHHTGQLAHPTIVKDRVYFNKHTYELRTGKVLGIHDFNWHGCGVMSASNHTVFSRYEYHGMLDLATNERTEFLGVRSGCWLSLIPSGGLLLAPETSAGCSCGHSIQTSIAYVPKALAADASAAAP